jgi:hypothetical protein
VRTAVGEHGVAAVLQAQDDPRPVEQLPRKKAAVGHFLGPTRHVPKVANVGCHRSILFISEAGWELLLQTLTPIPELLGLQPTIR